MDDENVSDGKILFAGNDSARQKDSKAARQQGSKADAETAAEAV